MPHAISVEVDELGDKVVRATIFVETESQKQIVVGKGGAIVKQIGTRARPEIEQLLGHQVFLELKVKARPKWRRDERCSSGSASDGRLLALFDVDGTLFLTDDPLVGRPARAVTLYGVDLPEDARRAVDHRQTALRIGGSSCASRIEDPTA